jgi:hypothetical protein
LNESSPDSNNNFFFYGNSNDNFEQGNSSINML